jgi:hypothetical protein
MPAKPDEHSPLVWRKSRASADAGACVEVAIRESSVLVRDSRNASRAVLAVTCGRWHELLKCIREGELGHG